MISVANLCLGDNVKVLSTGYISERLYIGQIGRLHSIERTSDHRVTAWLVDVAGYVVHASAVEPQPAAQSVLHNDNLLQRRADALRAHRIAIATLAEAQLAADRSAALLDKLRLEALARHGLPVIDAAEIAAQRIGLAAVPALLRRQAE